MTAGRLLTAVAVLALTGAAEAREFRTLYTFTGADGATPMPGLSVDAQGNLYGATGAGGIADKGTIFKIAPDGTRTTIFDFASGGGAVTPVTGLLVTHEGSFAGIARRADGQDGIAIYKVSPAGHGIVLATIDGAGAMTGLSEDANGNLYGTTTRDGRRQCGTVFRLTGHRLHKLYSFKGGERDGCSPSSPLVIDAGGNLIGTTLAGGTFGYPGGNGTIFKLAPDGHETVLHFFDGTAESHDGAQPYGALLADAEGNLAGTTYYGDATNAPAGTVYRLGADGSYSVLHGFGDRWNGDPDYGSYPLGGLATDAAGNLYGSTRDGGPGGLGVVFKLAPKGKETVLQWFHADNGAMPWGSLIADAKGNLFGTTSLAGPDVNARGTVFEIVKH